MVQGVRVQGIGAWDIGARCRGIGSSVSVIRSVNKTPPMVYILNSIAKS